VPMNGVCVHCFAAEPLATFIRVGVADGRREVAYETAVLGRLRHGYRVVQMRSAVLGTRIELCCLFVNVKFGMQRSVFYTPRQMRMQMDVEVFQRRRFVIEMCDNMKAELARDVKTEAWRDLNVLRPEAARAAVAQLEGRFNWLVLLEPEWYDEDAQLMQALRTAVDAKTAASSWPTNLTMLQQRSALPSLAELFQVTAVTMQARRDEKSIGPEAAYGACALLLLGSNLQELNLPGNQLGAAGAETLSYVLQRNTTLRVLGLAGSQFASNVTTAGAIHICSALEINSTLTKLSLSDNSLDGRDHEFKTALHGALLKNGSLVEIDFSYNRNLCRDGGCADAVLNAKAPLRRLNLLNTGVSASKAAELAMLNVDTLCGMNEYDTQFRAPNRGLDSGDGVLLAAELSRTHSKLTTVDISNNQLKDDAMKALTRAMRSSKDLSELLVGGNPFTEAAIQELKDVANLKGLNLDL